MQTVISFIIIFGVLVFVHELGHLVIAKRAGILCREFAIGFGPKVYSFRRGETLYTIRLLPLGGYVRMAGEDPEMVEIKPGQRVGLLLDEANTVTKLILTNVEKYKKAKFLEVDSVDLEQKLTISGFEDEQETMSHFAIARDAVIVEQGQETLVAPWDRQFASKTLVQRAATIFAGPFMNFVLAVVIFMAIALMSGLPSNGSQLGQLMPDGAAAKAGLKQGDKIVQIDDTPVKSWANIVTMVEKNPNQTVNFVIERGGKQRTIAVTPKGQEQEGKTVGKIGAMQPMKKSVTGAVQYGFTETYRVGTEIFKQVGKLFVGQFSIDQLSGPVGIYQTTDMVVTYGVIMVMKWAAVLSVNLGIINMLPFPALDGGRLLFILIEAVRGRPLDRQKEGLVHFVGFALLMLLMLVVTWNDIQRFFL